MRNKGLIITLVIIVAGIVAGVGFFILPSKSQKQSNPSPVAQQEDVVPTLSPSEIGLTMVMSDSGKNAGHSVIVTIGKPQDITAIDYELSYNADNPADVTQKIPRGAIGHFDIKSSDTSLRQEIVLGTCSDVCHYDKDVSDIKLILKVSKNDGKNYQVQQTFTP